MSQQKENTYKSIITPITTNDKQLIFGISFINPPDLLTLYKQHFYSLFLLIYFYGESEHISMVMSKLERCEKKIENKLQNHYLKCISKNDGHDQCQCQQKIKYDHQIKVLQFMQAQLSKNQCSTDRNTNINNKIFHTLLQRQLIRNAFVILFEQQKKLTYSSIMTLNDFSKLAGSLLDIQTTLKSYWNIEILQFHCQEFKDKNIQVFIQINKSQRNYQYIKKYELGIQNYSRNNQFGVYDMNKSLYDQEFSNAAFRSIVRIQDSFIMVYEPDQQKNNGIMEEEGQTDSINIEQQENQKQKQNGNQQNEGDNSEQYIQESFIQGNKDPQIKYGIQKKESEEYQQSGIIKKQSKQPIYKKHIYSPQDQFDEDKKQNEEYQYINYSQIKMTVSSLQFQLEKQYKKVRKPSQQLLTHEFNFQLADTNDNLFSNQSTINNKQLYDTYKKNQETKKITYNTQSMAIPRFPDNKKQRKISQEVTKTGFQNQILQENSDTQPIIIQQMEKQIKLQKNNEEQERERRNKILLSQHSLNISTSIILDRTKQFNQDLEQIFKFQDQISSEVKLQDFEQLLQNLSKQKIFQYQRILNEIEKIQQKDSQQNKSSNAIKTIVKKIIQQNIYKHFIRIQHIRKKIQLKKRNLQGNQTNQPNLNSQNQKNKYNLIKRGQQMIKFPQKLQETSQIKVKNLTKSILLQKGANLKQIISQEGSRNHPKYYEQKIENYETENSQISLKSSQLRTKQKQIWSQYENEDYMMSKSKMIHSKINEVLKDGQRNGEIFEEYDINKSKILKMSEYSPSKKVKQTYEKFSNKK